MNTHVNPNVRPRQPGDPFPAVVGLESRFLDAATPVVFLPVNIETRFMDTGDGASQLWVRLYPDQIAINSHEPELTAQEIADAQTYWNTVWRAGSSTVPLDAVKAPWRGLASLYGPERAAWVALQMTPTNIGQQPATSTPAGADPNPAPVFPAPVQRPSSWNRAVPVIAAI